jgi:hypothetical protein
LAAFHDNLIKVSLVVLQSRRDELPDALVFLAYFWGYSDVDSM